MATRLSRGERKEQTRADLLAAARRVFVRSGFRGASLDEIAEEAGYTKGAIYSNFEGKDDFFLALLEEHYARRIEAHREAMRLLDAVDADEMRREIARIMLDAYESEPAWWTLVADFSTHASRDGELRARLHELREAFLASMAELIETLAAHHHLVHTLSAHEIARGTGALLRGLMLDWILEPDGAERRRVFEETVAGFLRGVAVPLDERSTA
jgi:AcrR family transcriptional regulator